MAASWGLVRGIQLWNLGLKQKDAAARLGVTRPRLNDLLKGKIDKFSLDAQVNMPGHAGMRVEVSVKRAA